MTDSPKDCIFCKIVAGEIPCYKVYEDDQFLGFLDIAPFSRGHCLIIPKAHIRWVQDVPNVGQYFQTTTRVLKAVEKVLNPLLIHYLTWGDIHHAHIHIIPRYQDDNLGTPYQHTKHQPELKTAGSQMTQMAEKIFNQTSTLPT